jgi:hypothetical protein
MATTTDPAVTNDAPVSRAQGAAHRRLCLAVGVTADGRRWACCHPLRHVRYWFDHLALTGEPLFPVVLWREGGPAHYLTRVPGSDTDDTA